MSFAAERTAPGEIAVRLTGVSKTFGGVRALDDVSIEVRSGEIHALLGENGAGKSTILKILNGVHAPTTGRIEVYGTELTEHTPEAAKRAGIGMIFQEMSLVPTLTAAQNIFLNNEMKDSLGLIDDASGHFVGAMLVARRRALLEELASQLPVETRVVTLDLSTPSAIDVRLSKTACSRLV